jgi:hypothetical protein
MANLSSAADDLIKELRGINNNILLCYKATIYDTGSLLVYYTPIDTGLASSNWNVGNIGQVSIEREPIKGVKGLAALQEISRQVDSLVIGRDAYFRNPVDYISDLEAGTSKQARGGMINPTASRVDDLWMKNAKVFNL